MSQAVNLLRSDAPSAATPPVFLHSSWIQVWGAQGTDLEEGALELWTLELCPFWFRCWVLRVCLWEWRDRLGPAPKEQLLLTDVRFSQAGMKRPQTGRNWWECDVTEMRGKNVAKNRVASSLKAAKEPRKRTGHFCSRQKILGTLSERFSDLVVEELA